MSVHLQISPITCNVASHHRSWHLIKLIYTILLWINVSFGILTGLQAHLKIPPRATNEGAGDGPGGEVEVLLAEALVAEDPAVVVLVWDP